VLNAVASTDVDGPCADAPEHFTESVTIPNICELRLKPCCAVFARRFAGEFLADLFETAIP
jgi:hypothetical protein